MNQDVSFGRQCPYNFGTGGLLPQTFGQQTYVRPPKMKIKLVWSLQYKLVTISTISTSKYCMLICRLSRCRLVFTIHHFVRINLLIIIAFLVNTKKYQHHTVSIHFSALCPYSERNSRRNNGCMERYTGCLLNPGHCQSLSPESVFVSDLKNLQIPDRSLQMP